MPVSMQHHISTRLAFYGILVVLAVLLLLAAFYVNNSLTHRYQDDIYKATQKYLNDYHNQLFTNLQSHIQVVRGLPGLFAVNPKLTQEQYGRAVRHLVGDGSEIRNIAAAPDMVIRYMYPMAGNEAAIGLNYRTDTEQYAAAERARKSRELVLAGPLQLKQGGIGLITRIPVFLQDDNDQEYFWGLISAVIDIDRFFEKNGLNDPNMPIQLAIRGKDSLGQDGEVFFGDKQLFDSPRLQQTLQLPEGEWVLAAAPLNGWQRYPDAIWKQRLIIYGIAVAIFLLLAVLLRFIFSALLANQKFRRLIESSPVPYLLLNNDMHVSFINQAFTETYGYSLADMKSLEQWWQITAEPERYQEDFSNYLARLMTDNQAFTTELIVHTLSGESRIVLINMSWVNDNFDSVMLLGLYDITVRKQAEEQLRLSSQVFNQAQEGIIITNIAGAITDVNPAFCNITGYSKQDVLGQNPRLLKSGKHSADFFANMWKSISQQGFWQGEVWNRRKNGELYAELLSISALTDESGRSHHYVGLFSDITHSKHQQETLELMAHYDVLTKLPNRVLFADRFAQAAAHCRRTDSLLALCFLDLDNFKPVNDSYGHEVGDQLLIEVAVRLQRSVREEDTLSRFGGDEFAILFRDIDSQSECEYLLKRLHRTLAEPYVVDGLSLNISASSGVTFYPLDDADLDMLLRHADQAMYQAKLHGRNTYKVFNPADNNQTIEKQRWVQEISQALANQELCLYYQPRVNMRTGKVLGMEALLRWQHPQQGLLGPMQFLPAIEGTDVEVELGNWVLNTALDAVVHWHQAGEKMDISVNIASSHLQATTFIRDIELALVGHPDVEPQCLQLEIVETSALGDVATISKVIHLCSSVLGVSVALDDFGTGYSSLTHLRHLTAKTIKIDRGFIRDMLDDPQDYTIVDGIIGLADAFNREVIAEGVETEEHGLMLLTLGCEQAQGFGIAKPMPTEKVLGWLQQYQPNQRWLDDAAKPLSVSQRASKLFKLITRRWHQTLLDNLDKPVAAIEHWPIIDSQRCHCGSWIRRIAGQELADEAWLTRLEERHEQCHYLAYQLQEQHLAGENDISQLKQQFDQAFIKMLTMVESEFDNVL